MIPGSRLALALSLLARLEAARSKGVKPREGRPGGRAKLIQRSNIKEVSY